MLCDETVAAYCRGKRSLNIELASPALNPQARKKGRTLRLDPFAPGDKVIANRERL